MMSALKRGWGLAKSWYWTRSTPKIGVAGCSKFYSTQTESDLTNQIKQFGSNTHFFKRRNHILKFALTPSLVREWVTGPIGCLNMIVDQRRGSKYSKILLTLFMAGLFCGLPREGLSDWGSILSTQQVRKGELPQVKVYDSTSTLLQVYRSLGRKF